MVLKALAGGFNFAHFAGLGRSSKKDAPAEDLRDQHDDEAAASAAAAETEECEEDEEEDAAAAAGKKGGKKSDKKDDEEDETSEGEDDGDDEDEDQDEEAKEEGKGKGKKAAAPQPAKAAAKSGAADVKRGRKAERRRIGLILSNKAAAANLPFACKLACNTGMSSAAAIALLEQTPAAPAGRGGRLDRAMSDAKVPDVKAGSPEAPKGEAAISASWDSAMQSFMPKK